MTLRACFILWLRKECNILRRTFNLFKSNRESKHYRN